jgi:hypothetical protein
VLVLGNILHETQSFVGTIARSEADNSPVLFGFSAQTYTADRLSILSHACYATAEIIGQALEFPQYGDDVEGFDEQSVSELQEHLVLMKERKGVLDALYRRISDTKLSVLLLGRISAALHFKKKKLLTETIR